MNMAELRLEFSKEDYASLESNEIGIADFLNKVLPLKVEDVSNPENRLINLLLSYHSDDGGAITVTRAALDQASYNVGKKSGKIGFKYHLAYHYACSYSDMDYEKNDKVDFVLDTAKGIITLTFLDLNTRSTAEEF